LILVALGTQDFQFDRLLKEIDKLITEGIITDKVVVQSGYSSYQSDKFRSIKFLTFEEFDNLLSECNILITHGGTGTIINALKKNKKVIAVARLKEYGEHVDDHQTELVKLYSGQGLVSGVLDIKELREKLMKIDEFKPNKFVSGNKKIVSMIENFIKNNINNIVGETKE
jgi:UDP-N-acetylglucosamine transferase subunit ALG13